MINLRPARTRVFALVPLLILLAGCPFSPEKGGTKPDDPPPPPPDYKVRTSISNVLFNLRLSWTEKNITEYTALLHPEFTFIFSPQDVGGPNNIPEEWGRADELESITNLFGSKANVDGYRCETIRLTFTAGPETPAQQYDTTWTKVTLTEVHLQVDSRHEISGLQLLYEVLGDQADFYFKETAEIDPVSQKKLWQIVLWEDKPRGVLAAMN